MSQMNTTEVVPETRTPVEPSTEKKLSLWVAVVLVGVAAALGLAIFMGIRTREVAASRLSEQAEKSTVVPVSVIHPAATSSGQDVILPGNTQPFIEAPIYARTNGYLKRWYADIGAHVRRGQLLAEIETPETDQQLAQARAEQKSAQANLNLARITAERWQNLLKTNSVSKQETDQAVSDLSAKEAALDSSSANVRRLEQLQSFEKVYAPFDGVITARNTDIGALIDAGATATPKALFSLASVSKLRIFVSVPESYASAARNGATVKLNFEEFPGQEFQGTIVRNANAIDAVSRTLNVEVDLANGGGKIMPGAYAFVHLPLPGSLPGVRGGSLTIPANTLLFRSEGLRVGVVRNDRATLVPISIGRDFGNEVEVVSGLSAADAVILNPADSLITGTPVRVDASKGGTR